MALSLFLGLLAVAPNAVAQAAETTLWFVGEGDDEVVTSPDGDGIYEMSPEGHGGQTSSFVTVLGNSVENNPFLPTFTYDVPVVLTGGTITAYHHAAVTGAAAGCGLVGYLYSGADVLAQTELVPATDGLAYEEFVFVFEGVEGTHASLSFQPVQSANQCGWASIEHVWGSDEFPGRLILPAAETAQEAVDASKVLFENLTAPAFLHAFDNATSDDYTLNFTVPWRNATIQQTASVVSGSANVTVLRDGEVFMAALLTNQTAPAAPAGNGTADGNATGDDATEAPVLRDVAGNWSVVIDYEGFVGTLGIELSEHVPAPEPADANVTDEPALDADVHEDTPGPALPLLVLGVLAVALVRRRR